MSCHVVAGHKQRRMNVLALFLRFSDWRDQKDLNPRPTG